MLRLFDLFNENSLEKNSKSAFWVNFKCSYHHVRCASAQNKSWHERSPFTYLTLCERCQNKFLKSPIWISLGVHVFFITVWTASPKLTCFCLSCRSVAWLQVLLSIQKQLEGQFTGSMFAPHLVSVLRCHTLNGTTHYFYSCPHILRHCPTFLLAPVHKRKHISPTDVLTQGCWNSKIISRHGSSWHTCRITA